MLLFARKFLISTRLYFLFASFLGTICFIYFFLNFMTITMRKDVEKINHLIDFSRELQVNFKVQVQEWKNTLMRGYSEEDYNKYSGSFFKLSKQIQADLLWLEKEGKEIPSLKEEVKSLREKHLELEKSYKHALSKYNKKDFLTVQIVDTEVKGIDREPTKKFDDIVILLQKYSKEQVQKDQNILQGIMIFSGIFFILSTIFIIGTIIRSINLPLNQIVRNLEIAIGAKDLTSRVPVEANDELSSIGINCNSFIVQLQEIIKILLKTTEGLKSTSVEFSASAGEMSKLTSVNAQSVEEIHKEVDQVSSLVTKTHDNSIQQYEILGNLRERIFALDTVIKETELKVNSSLATSNKITQTITLGDNSLKSMNSNMKNISESSLKISGIVLIINDISKQINLLSLNAAIEAARAGESGKGFAVVADEIANLADKTSRSIKQIDTLIRTNNEEIQIGNKSVESVIEMLNKVIAGIVSISSEIKELFDLNKKQREIHNSVLSEMASVKDLANASKQATEQEEDSFREIRKAVSEINEIANQNANSAEHISKGSDQIEIMAENLYTAVSVFKV